MKPSDPKKLHETLLRDLTDLKLLRIAATYAEVLDAAARKGCSTLEVLAELVGSEAAARQERSLERRIKRAHLPQRKTLEEYDFSPTRRMLAVVSTQAVAPTNFAQHPETRELGSAKPMRKRPIL